MTERPLLTVGGLIVAADGEILLVRSTKWQNLYSLPGGKVEWGEKREDAFVREVWEETQLKICNIRFAIVQDCIFSPEFWQKKHFVMNDFIADLDPSCSKESVQLNDEAHTFIWISPQRALDLPLHHECRILIEWYIKQLQKHSTKDYGIVGIHQHQVSCVIGLLPEERLQEQKIFFDVKIKVDLSSNMATQRLEDTVDYVAIAKICNQLAQQNQYFLLETLASDIIDECLRRFPAYWVSVVIKKPGAIASAAYAFVELERYKI